MFRPGPLKAVADMLGLKPDILFSFVSCVSCSQRSLFLAFVWVTWTFFDSSLVTIPVFRVLLCIVS